MNLPRPPEWTIDALCAQIGGDLWFPPKGGDARTPKRICMQCPVRVECLDYALAFESGDEGTPRSYPSGIYGGLSERERRSLRNERRAS